MKGVDLYARVRRAVYVEGMSQRGAARYFGIDPRTVAKMMRFSVPPGYRRSRPPARPKLDPFTEIIDQILDDDASMPAKQRHTAKRFFERLRDEHGYGAAACSLTVSSTMPSVSPRSRSSRSFSMPTRQERTPHAGRAVSAIGVPLGDHDQLAALARGVGHQRVLEDAPRLVPLGVGARASKGIGVTTGRRSGSAMDSPLPGVGRENPPVL
jgi:hypothetical protein